MFLEDSKGTQLIQTIYLVTFENAAYQYTR